MRLESSDQEDQQERVSCLFYLIDMQLIKQAMLYYKRMAVQMTTLYAHQMNLKEKQANVFDILFHRMEEQCAMIKVTNRGLGMVVAEGDLKKDLQVVASIIIEQQRRLFQETVLREQQSNYMIKRQLELSSTLNQAYS